MIRGESIRVTGTVQGVGFRPTVWRLARDHDLVGDVCNDAQGVLIHAYGDADSLDRFAARLRSESPPLASIESLQRTSIELPAAAPPDFAIVPSAGGTVTTNVTADAATCPDCLADVLDATNRRHRYPFTNCTHCGPRLSIVRSVPYDRANTAMAVFPMCVHCQAEYDDPADRRYHAQPNACPLCGPSVWLERRDGARLDLAPHLDALAAAAQHLREGKILCIKGIGGFHLACDAGNPTAVAELRRRKRRPRKPLALMARDLDMICRHAQVSDAEARRLRATDTPIVLLARIGSTLPDAIAPGSDTLGFMLPYTALHHLLLHELDGPLVMTSGNRSGEPQVIDNAQAVARLGDIADLFVMHDRDIVNRLDDSVACVVDEVPRLLRRARGLAPAPIALAAGLLRGLTYWQWAAS